MNHNSSYMNPQLLGPGDFSGKKPGVGCYFPLQRIFLTQKLNPSFRIAGRLFTTEPPS